MKTIITKLFITCIAVLMSSSQSFSQWSSNWKWSMGNPTGDAVRYIQMLSANEWVGLGFNGGLIKTTNAGLNWTSRSDVSSYTGFSHPHIRDGWFMNSSTGFAVGDQNFATGIISKTTNGGSTWTNFLTGLNVSSVYFLNNNTGFTVGNLVSGHKTINGGVSWTPMTMGGSGNLQDVFALDANNIYAVGAGLFFKSTDGGSTWSNTSVSPNYASLFSVYFKDANTGFAGGDAGAFFVTTDGGTSWTSRTAPATENLMKEIQFNDPEILLVGDDENIYKTTDYGLNWELKNFANSAPADNVKDGMFSIDKLGSSIVIAGYSGLIYSSNDNGNSWTTLSSVKHNSYLQGIYASSMSGKIWVVGGAAPHSVLYSSNGGADWLVNTGGAQNTNLRDVEFLNDNTGYACGEGGTIYRTSNGGTTWTQIPSNTIQAANTIEIVDNNVVLVGCNAGKLFRSTNAGLNFTELQIGINSVQFNSISFPNENTGWASMSRTILKSTDKGLTWAAQLNHSTTILKVAMVDVNTGYACGYTGSLLKTTNGGVNWSPLSSPIPNNLTGIDFADANNGFAISGGPLMPGASMKTSNGGASWQIINSGSNPLYGLKVLHSDSAIAVGYGNIVKYSAPKTGFNLYMSMNFELSPKDTITVELRNNTAPYNLIETKKSLAGEGTDGLFNYTTVTNGTPYYIVVKHRNAIQTWSTNAVSFSGNTLNYNFTSAASQAYGNNMKNVNGLWSYYQGDINQDEEINLQDILAVYNDGSNYVSGSYVLTDLNRDGFTDLTDLIATSNNSSNFITVRKP